MIGVSFLPAAGKEKFQGTGECSVKAFVILILGDSSKPVIEHSRDPLSYF
jgi:hypothetical protein